MNKKGFTLIEMISAIAIMIVLSTILIINVSKKINDSREKSYSTLIQSIELAAESYISSTTDYLNTYYMNDWYNLPLQTLIENNYFEKSLINPLTNKALPSTDVVYITRNYNGKINASYNINQNTDSKITLIGKYNYYVLVGTTFVDPGIIATDKYGNNVNSSVTTTNNINTNVIGNYTKTYTYGNTSIIRNILVVNNTRYQIESNWKLLTINPNGGSYDGQKNNIFYSLKENHTINLTIPVKQGQSFAQWRSSSNSTTISLADSIYTLTMGNEDTVIEAVWGNEVYLEINLAGGSITPNPEGLYASNTHVSMPNPTRTGHIFTGWTGGVVTNNEIVMGETNITLTATWLSYSDMFTYIVGGNPGVSGTDYEIIDDENSNWRIKFLTSGTFTPLIDMTIDIFLVGGGGGGGHAISENNDGAAGGGGGHTNTITSQTLITNNNYPIVIGSGGLRGNKGPGTAGGESTFTISELTIYKADGGTGGTSYWGYMVGGSGGSGGGGNGQAGSAYGTGGTGSGWGATGIGQEETTCEFGMGTTTGCYTGVTGYPNGEVTAYAGGGSGCGNTTIPTAGSCGNYGCSPTTNSGGGGGGARYYNGAPGVGATGIVIIRNSR